MLIVIYCTGQVSVQKMVRSSFIPTFFMILSFHPLNEIWDACSEIFFLLNLFQGFFRTELSVHYCKLIAKLLFGVRGLFVSGVLLKDSWNSTLSFTIHMACILCYLNYWTVNISELQFHNMLHTKYSFMTNS